MSGLLLPALGCAGSPARGGGSAAPPERVEATATPDPDRIERPAYRLEPGDTIRIVAEPGIDRTAKVRSDGVVAVDLIGEVQAAGRELPAVEDEIEERIGSYVRHARVTVSLEESASQWASVVGEVGDPSNVRLDRRVRLMEALAEAGGVTELAATSRVRVVREGGMVVVDVDAIRGGDARRNLLLRPGDVVVVPAAVPVVAGYKLRRALYPLEAVLRAVAAAFLPTL